MHMYFVLVPGRLRSQPAGPFFLSFPANPPSLACNLDRRETNNQLEITLWPSSIEVKIDHVPTSVGVGLVALVMLSLNVFPSHMAFEATGLSGLGACCSWRKLPPPASRVPAAALGLTAGRASLRLALDSSARLRRTGADSLKKMSAAPMSD
eukprot:363185-Chlamydomonas_euryale.AAC.13